ncbi:MAG: GNAT family N-acetyltransferase [Eisenbergiella sp.]
MNIVYTALSRIKKRSMNCSMAIILLVRMQITDWQDIFARGESARIPTKESFCYSDDRLDIGLGMHPALCGKGMGYDFVLSGIKYLSQQRPDIRFRLTVACFNERAVSLYKKLGFMIEKTVMHKTLGKPFYIMSRREV